MTEKPPLPKPLRRELERLAHGLKPEFQVGRDGLSEAFVSSLYEAFNTKELLKIKLLDTSEEDRRSLAGKLDALPDIYLIRNIGRTFILYKEMKEDEA